MRLDTRVCTAAAGVVSVQGVSNADGSTVPPAATTGMQCRGEATCDREASLQPEAPTVPAVEPSDAMSSMSANEEAFVPRNLDDLPDRPQMQPLVVSKADLIAQRSSS